MSQFLSPKFSGDGLTFRELLSSVPLYGNLDDNEIADIALGIRRLTFEAGERIVRQGDKADGILIILNGMATVTMALPGGGETHVADLGSGSIIGELAAIRQQTRNATVSAIGQVDAIFADWHYLTASLAQLRPGAFKVFRNIAEILSYKALELHDKIHSVVFEERNSYELLKMPACTDNAMPPAMNFDLLAFLCVLPCFCDVNQTIINSIFSQTLAVSIAKGEGLNVEDERPESAFIVVRGAIASGFVHDDRFHLVGVRGPGTFCKLSAIISGRPSNHNFIAFENSVLLKVPRDVFFGFYLGHDGTAHFVLTSAIEHLANTIARATNHLKRLVGLNRAAKQLLLRSSVNSQFDIF